MNTSFPANAATLAGRPSIPSELGSRIAKASIRLVELEEKLAGVPELEDAFRKLETWARELVTYATTLEAHARYLEATINKQQTLIEQELAPLAELGRRVRLQRGLRLLRKAILRRRPPVALEPGAYPVNVQRRPPAGEPAGQPASQSLPAEVSSLEQATPCGQQTGQTIPALADRSVTHEASSHAVPYAVWIQKNEPGITELRAQTTTWFTSAVRISILVPGRASSEAFLQAMLDSVLQQTYGGWELCLAQRPGGEELPRKLDLTDDRIKPVRVDSACGAAEASNRLLAAATGEYVTVLDPDDTLAPFALHEIAQAIDCQPGIDLLYSDEDCLDELGQRLAPLFKPEWSPDTLRSHNYVGRPYILSRALLDRAGRFRDGFEGQEDYDLVLRASELAGGITHVPKVLYHRRGAALPSRRHGSGDPCHDTAQRALGEHLHRLGCAAEVKAGLRPGTYDVRYPLAVRPLVSILIASRDNVEMLGYCVDSIRRSSYPNREIHIIENGSQQPETFAYYERLRSRPNTHVHVWKRPFNYSAINNEAVRRAQGPILLFLNNNVQAINEDWIERMLEHALRPQVGAVGAKLYFADDTIQHAGALVGTTHGPHHIFAFADRAQAGYGNRLVVTQNLSAVTAACLMIRREVFEEVGGFDEGFAVAFNDVDLCLKARQKGYLVVWTPHAELYHFESVTRGYNVDPADRAFESREYDSFIAKWRACLSEVDPYYNPNLNLSPPDGTLRG